MEDTSDEYRPIDYTVNDQSQSGTPSFIYAIGQVDPRLPSLGVEKELAQATGRAKTASLTDREALHAVLAQRENRYLARQLCWVLTVEGVETYLLAPRTSEDLDLLIESIRPAPSALDVDVVIGTRGPLAPPQLCNGLTAPIVYFDQIYSFDREALIDGIPGPASTADKKEIDRFKSAAGELFDRIMQLADNAGATDEHRALNYLAVRYPAIYARTAEAHQANASLTGVEARPSRLYGVRRIMDVIFSYSDRATDVTEKAFVRVDVTEEFPFLMTRLSPFYDR